MTPETALAAGVMVVAFVVCVVLLFVTAPYGRHARGGWGPTLPSRLGWMVMESPASVGFLVIFLYGDARGGVVPALLLLLWQAHYLHRTFIYPRQLRGAECRLPWVIVFMAVVFNGVNAWLNARWISQPGHYDDQWLHDPRWIIGLALFLGGRAVNLQSEGILRRLRAAGESGYRVPHGGLFRWISCPNYLGEIVEWTGWAIATWSLPGLAFAVFTAANLVPRALAHQRWYRATFSDYPPARRALIPFVL
jgi:3-oxo-5-alpha-steroid 4-dehydrogenase 1